MQSISGGQELQARARINGKNFHKQEPPRGQMSSSAGRSETLLSLPAELVELSLDWEDICPYLARGRCPAWRRTLPFACYAGQRRSTWSGPVSSHSLVAHCGRAERCAGGTAARP